MRITLSGSLSDHIDVIHRQLYNAAVYLRLYCIARAIPYDAGTR